MPYHIGEKGSNGCAGYPVVSDAGHVAGCHPTEANAQEQLGALYANVADAGKADTPMDVSYNATVTDPTPANPSSSINPSVGMNRPQYMMNFGRQVGAGIKDKRVVDIWTVKADGPMPENPIMPTQTYEGCECDECAANNTSCANCATCGGMDAEREIAAYDASLGKADPCWEGYVQRGMKPGDNGSMVPNCVPVSKSDEAPVEQPAEPAQDAAPLSFFNFRDLRPTRNTVRLGE